jgi:hypothetical protein
MDDAQVGAVVDVELERRGHQRHGRAEQQDRRQQSKADTAPQRPVRGTYSAAPCPGPFTVQRRQAALDLIHGAPPRETYRMAP